MKNVLLLLFLTFSAISNALHFPAKVSSIIFQNETEINQKDSQGRKQGRWVILGKDKPYKGYPDDGKIEEGNYKDNRKHGTWIKYYKDGKTPRVIGEFNNGRPKGKYKKMYTSGKVKEEGTFENGKHKGKYTKFFENGRLAQEKNFNEAGLEEGTQKYYYPNGQVELELTKSNGVNTGKSYRYTKDGQLEEVVTYKEDGKVASVEEKEITEIPTGGDEEGTGGPNGSNGNMRGMVFDKNGYNKVYNDDEELWLDGKFKNGKLWDGKLYKYDSDGILLKIEVWKNGKYHSDGQL